MIVTLNTVQYITNIVELVKCELVNRLSTLFSMNTMCYRCVIDINLKKNLQEWFTGI